jgi:UDP-N-acetylglucosamine 2-epimerase (non-hydrolysing)
MEEVLDYYIPKIEISDVLDRENLEPRRFFIVSAHREENVDSPENLKQLVSTLHALAEQYGFPVIVSTHPRTQKRLAELDDSPTHPLIRFVKPFGLLDYIKLQMSAFCVISDSGTLTEESSILNFPAITIRNAHERPEGMDEGTLIMSGLTSERVLESVKVVTDQFLSEPEAIKIVSDYRGGSVSKKVVRVVLSYIDYINRVVWSK